MWDFLPSLPKLILLETVVPGTGRLPCVQRAALANWLARANIGFFVLSNVNRPKRGTCTPARVDAKSCPLDFGYRCDAPRLDATASVHETNRAIYSVLATGDRGRSS